MKILKSKLNSILVGILIFHLIFPHGMRPRSWVFAEEPPQEINHCEPESLPFLIPYWREKLHYQLSTLYETHFFSHLGLSRTRTSSELNLNSIEPQFKTYQTCLEMGLLLSEEEEAQVSLPFSIKAEAIDSYFTFLEILIELHLKEPSSKKIGFFETLPSFSLQVPAFVFERLSSLLQTQKNKWGRPQLIYQYKKLSSQTYQVYFSRSFLLELELYELLQRPIDHLHRKNLALAVQLFRYLDYRFRWETHRTLQDPSHRQNTPPPVPKNLNEQFLSLSETDSIDVLFDENQQAEQEAFLRTVLPAFLQQWIATQTQKVPPSIDPALQAFFHQPALIQSSIERYLHFSQTRLSQFLSSSPEQQMEILNQIVFQSFILYAKHSLPSFDLPPASLRSLLELDPTLAQEKIDQLKRQFFQYAPEKNRPFYIQRLLESAHFVSAVDEKEGELLHAHSVPLPQMTPALLYETFSARIDALEITESTKYRLDFILSSETYAQAKRHFNQVILSLMSEWKNRLQTNAFRSGIEEAEANAHLLGLNWQTLGAPVETSIHKNETRTFHSEGEQLLHRWLKSLFVVGDEETLSVSSILSKFDRLPLIGKDRAEQRKDLDDLIQIGKLFQFFQKSRFSKKLNESPQETLPQFFQKENSDPIEDHVIDLFSGRPTSNLQRFRLAYRKQLLKKYNILNLRVSRCSEQDQTSPFNELKTYCHAVENAIQSHRGNIPFVPDNEDGIARAFQVLAQYPLDEPGRASFAFGQILSLYQTEIQKNLEHLSTPESSEELKEIFSDPNFKSRFLKIFPEFEWYLTHSNEMVPGFFQRVYDRHVFPIFMGGMLSAFAIIGLKLVFKPVSKASDFLLTRVLKKASQNKLSKRVLFSTAQANQRFWGYAYQGANHLTENYVSPLFDWFGVPLAAFSVYEFIDYKKQSRLHQKGEQFLMGSSYLSPERVQSIRHQTSWSGIMVSAFSLFDLLWFYSEGARVIRATLSGNQTRSAAHFVLTQNTEAQQLIHRFNTTPEEIDPETLVRALNAVGITLPSSVKPKNLIAWASQRSSSTQKAVQKAIELAILEDKLRPLIQNRMIVLQDLIAYEALKLNWKEVSKMTLSEAILVIQKHLDSQIKEIEGQLFFNPNRHGLTSRAERIEKLKSLTHRLVENIQRRGHPLLEEEIPTEVLSYLENFSHDRIRIDEFSPQVENMGKIWKEYRYR